MAAVTDHAAEESAADESADQWVRRLDIALKRQRLATEIIEPSTKIKAFAPNGNPTFDEILTLRQGDDEVLTWFWSWGDRLGPAADVDATVRAVEGVVGQARA